MKVSTRQLARAFFELVEDKGEKEAKAMVVGLVRFLARENLLGRINDFVVAFSAIWNDKAGLVEAEIVTAHPLDAATKNKLAEYVKGRTGAKEVSIQDIEDKDQLGGVILNYQDKTARASLKDWIGQLESIMVK
jgi:F-type H+-transporting ATPase subunit delta